jgi:hypothetical protein
MPADFFPVSEHMIKVIAQMSISRYDDLWSDQSNIDLVGIVFVNVFLMTFI